MNQKLIQQLKNGEIAVINNGTLEQLRQVLKEAFPEDKGIAWGAAKYYMAEENKNYWTSLPYKSIPSVNIQKFIENE